MNSDNDQLLIVTGGGTGMGRDIALAQAARGRDVLVVGRRAQALNEVVNAAASGGRIESVQADLSKVDDIDRVLIQIGDRPVIGLVAAAGGNTGPGQDTGNPIERVRASWAAAIEANLTTAVLLSEAVIPLLMPGRSRIVFIGSTAGLTGSAGPYGAAKAAVHAYSRDLARRLGGDGITVNSVAPGFVGETEFFDFLGDVATITDVAAKATLIGRVGIPRDITSCVEWLLSEEAGWTTGQLISVNGGSVLVR